jgi:plastocyanin
MTLAVLVLALPLAAMVPTSSAADVPLPRLYVTLVATEVGANPRYTPQNAEGETVIVIPQVPIILNITLIFDDTFDHTFTIRSTDAAAPTPQLVNVDLPVSMGRGNSKTVEFTIVNMGTILYEGRNESVEAPGSRIRFFCIPHEAANMVGFFAVGGYWIGLLGFAATLLLVGISYFVIKGSSRHYQDHHEHIRRGGP